MKWIFLICSLIANMAWASADGDAFQNALMKNDVASIKSLAQKGFDPNQKLNDLGESPLTLAALNGRPDVIEILSSSGKVDVNHQTENGWTALMFAARAQSFGHRGQKKTETKEYIKVVEMLLKMGADKSIKNKHGQDALTIAQISKNTEIEKLLKSK